MKEEYCLDIKDNIYRVDKMITTSLESDNKEDVEYPPLDPAHPYLPVLTGSVAQSVICGETERAFTIYIPEAFAPSGPSLFVFPDDGVSSAEYLEQEGKLLAEELKVALVVLEARDGGWSRRDIQDEICYAEAVFNKANNRNYVGLNEPTYYTMGLGNGAYVSTAYAILNSATIAALLEDGDFHLDERLLNQLSQIHSDRNAAQKKTDVPIISWLSEGTASGDTQVLDTLVKACSCTDLGLRTENARVYQQNMKTFQTTASDLPAAEVRYTDYALRETLDALDLHRDMISFALRYKRWLGIGNGQIRPASTYQEMGMIRVEKEIGGLLREWYLYIPDVHKQNPDAGLPLLIGLHGYSNTGVMFAGSGEWCALAEECGFFAVFPTGYPSGRIGPNTVPLPAWNSSFIGQEGEAGFSDADDVGFILDMIEEIRKQYPIDSERIYVTGHSNGSMLTNKLMDEVPQIFAAFGPQAAQYHLSLDGKPVTKTLPDDGIIRPVWLIMGHEDIGDRDSLEENSANSRFLDMMCRANGLDRSADHVLVNGKVTTHTFVNEKGVPLLKFSGVNDMPHCYTPALARMVWNEFFCRYRRKADGSIEYTY